MSNLEKVEALLRKIGQKFRDLKDLEENEYRKNHILAVAPKDSNNFKSVCMPEGMTEAELEAILIEGYNRWRSKKAELITNELIELGVEQEELARTEIARIKGSSMFKDMAKTINQE